MVQRRKIAVFDLDGTFYSGPSLRHFFTFGAKRLLGRGRVVEASAILMRFAAWKFAHICSHADMKYANCRILERLLTQADVDKFVEKLDRRINPHVLALLEQCRSDGMLTVLATASPEFYCEPLARKYGFDFCQATATTSERKDYVENRGAVKMHRAMALPGEVTIVVTDHSDDMPLLRANSGTNYLVKPSAKTLSEADEAHIRFEKL